MSPSMQGHDKDPDTRLETGSSDLDCSNLSGADVQQWDILRRHGADLGGEPKDSVENGPCYPGIDG
ncbi:hypothetical protein [Shimia thalassica]|uniref:hypothetical protein n=1 Tax=Shimia thalassica TaxID=1715693 RepID=UPI0026F497E9|nr:hypothetical protein [Shimia thalassica]